MVTMIYVLLIMPGVVDKSSSVQDAVSEISNVETKISNTQISFSSLTTSAGSTLVTSTIDNSGTEKLWNFNHFDHIITYNGTTSKSTEILEYAGKCGGSNPSTGKWCINSIDVDLLDPDILNQGESMTIKARVSQTISTGTLTVLLSTDNGVVTTKSKTT